MMDDEIFEEFQCAVEDNYGKLKGAQSEALKEAVLLWLAHKKDYPVFIMRFTRVGKSFVFRVAELGARLHEALSTRRLPDILVQTIGICPQGYIAEALRVLLDVYGPPNSAEIEIFRISKPLTETDPEKIERAFWEAEDGSSGDVEAKFIWRKQRVIATFFPDTFIIRKANFMSFERGAGAKIRSPTKEPELGAEALQL